MCMDKLGLDSPDFQQTKQDIAKGSQWFGLRRGHAINRCAINHFKGPHTRIAASDYRKLYTLLPQSPADSRQLLLCAAHARQIRLDNHGYAQFSLVSHVAPRYTTPASDPPRH